MRVENTPPQEKSVPETKKEKHPKKKRKWLKWLIILIIIFSLPLTLLGATGIYNIPVVSHIFRANKPINLGVKVTSEALASAMAGNPMTLKGDAASYSGVGNKIFSGEVKVDTKNTSEEVTSFLNHYTQNAPHIRDLQVKYIEGGLEISTFVKTYIKAPVYVKVGVQRTSSKSVDLDLTKVKIGIIPVPKRYYDQIEKAAEEIINNRMKEIPGFSMDVLEYHDSYALLKGTLPKTVEMVSGERPVF